MVISPQKLQFRLISSKQLGKISDLGKPNLSLLIENHLVSAKIEIYLVSGKKITLKSRELPQTSASVQAWYPMITSDQSEPCLYSQREALYCVENNYECDCPFKVIRRQGICSW